MLRSAIPVKCAGNCILDIRMQITHRPLISPQSIRADSLCVFFWHAPTTLGYNACCEHDTQPAPILTDDAHSTLHFGHKNAHQSEPARTAAPRNIKVSACSKGTLERRRPLAQWPNNDKTAATAQHTKEHVNHITGILRLWCLGDMLLVGLLLLLLLRIWLVPEEQRTWAVLSVEMCFLCTGYA